MKKTLMIFAAVMLATTYCSAQFSQGMWCLTAEVGIHNYKSENDFGGFSGAGTSGKTEDIWNTTNLSFGGAYFVSENINVGLKIGIDNTKSEDNSSNTNLGGTTSNNMTTTTNLFNVCATGDWFSNTGSKVGAVVGAKGMYTSGKHEDESSNTNPFGTSTSIDEYKVSGFGAHITPGAYVKLTECLFLMAFMGGFNYHSLTYDLDAASQNGMAVDLAGISDEETDSELWFDINPRNYTFRIAYYFGGTGPAN